MYFHKAALQQSDVIFLLNALSPGHFLDTVRLYRITLFLFNRYREKFDVKMLFQKKIIMRNSFKLSKTVHMPFC